MTASPEAGPRRRRTPRLFWRIYLHGVGLLLLVGVTLSLAALFFEPQPPASKVARLLAAVVRDRPEGEALTADVHRLADAARVAAAVYGDDGHLVAANRPDAPPPLPASDVARLRAGESVFHPHRLFAVPAGSGRYLAVALPGGVSEPLLLHAFLVMLAVIAILALGSLPLARTIARPLEQLSEAARRLGAGELSARSRVRAAGELGALGAAFDEMAERLERLVLGQRELLANVSHELRTPLARIKVTLGLAAEGDAEAAQRYLDELGVDVAELERLVEDLLTAARLEAGYGSVLRSERVEVAALLADAARRLERVHRGRVPALDVAGDLPAVEADPSLLGRALDNLFDNAAKYSEAGTPIRAAARRDGDAVAIEIRDSGIGIDAADLPRLFTPFFRTDRSRSRGTGGVGLGLALAKRIVEAHGGTIAVDSRPGEGTTVTLRLRPAGPDAGRLSS